MNLPTAATLCYPSGRGGLLRTCISRFLVGLFVVWGTGAFASPATGAARFEALRAQDLRVATVAYRLATANTSLCRTAMALQHGLVLHDIRQYRPADRAQAALHYGLDRHVGIMAVVPSSPAARAGMLPGDQLLAINGSALSDPVMVGESGRTAVDDVEARLSIAMQKGAAGLTLLSPGGTRYVRLVAERGCPATVELVAGDDVNAWADGSRILVGAGLLQRCATDDDLALVIGHEMAHNLLHHTLSAGADAVHGLLPLTADQSSAARSAEEAADRYAVQLATRAGYDMSGADVFIGGLMTAGAAAGMTHPTLSRRLVVLREAIAKSR